MSDGRAVIYLYDGSLEGLLTCVFESFDKKEHPAAISAGLTQGSLFTTRTITTDLQKAERVMAGIRKKMGEEGWKTVEDGYYTCHPEKELLILRFVKMGMRLGRKVNYLLTDNTVADLQKAVRHLYGEAHQYKGFVRFSVYGKVLGAVIEPKNTVLPFLAAHFCDRYRNEAFVIYDKVHRSMLAYRPEQYVILSDVDYQPPKAGEEETAFRSLWKNYYETIAIEERYNPRCRMGHMQKRYWNQLTEMDETVPVRPEEAVIRKALEEQNRTLGRHEAAGQDRRYAFKK